jgi:hypothetical protein
MVGLGSWIFTQVGDAQELRRLRITRLPRRGSNCSCSLNTVFQHTHFLVKTYPFTTLPCFPTPKKSAILIPILSNPSTRSTLHALVLPKQIPHCFRERVRNPTITRIISHEANHTAAIMFRDVNLYRRSLHMNTSVR